LQVPNGLRINFKTTFGGYMRKFSLSFTIITMLLTLLVLGSIQLNGASGGKGKYIPVTIFSSAYQHIPSLAGDAAKIVKNVRAEFNLYEKQKNFSYHKAKVDVIDEDNDNKGDFLIVYLLKQATYDSETVRIFLGSKYEFVSKEYGYEIQYGDSSGDRLPAVKACNCPDNNIEVLVSSCEDGISTAVEAVNYVYNLAIQKGYTAKKLLGTGENVADIQNWLCCPNLKFWGRVGHGTTQYIVLDDGNLTYTYFDGLSSTQIQNKVFYWNSCQVFNNPIKTSVLNKNVAKFIGGICNLYIGPSENVFKCWSDKNLGHIAAPAGTTDTMCYWLTNCESGTGYPELGCHGCGGPGNTFPMPGGATNYTLTVSVSGQGTVTLNPSGGSYPSGTVVTLTANPAADWSFSSWSGDLSGSQNPATITMNSNKSVTAAFFQNNPLPPVANFTASATTISVGQSVTFTDTSTNNPTAWSWTFPGGTPSSSTARNPVVTYNTVGVYNVTLMASNSQGSNTTTKTNYITVTNVAYCASKSNNYSYEYIKSVKFGSVTKTSTGSYYSDFTSTVFNLTRGASVSFTLTPGFASTTYTEYWKVWIDYNKDGDFADTGEQIYAGSGKTPKTTSFTVSSGASTGNTRMRVSMKYSATPTYCETFSYGEVEDYTAAIQ